VISNVITNNNGIGIGHGILVDGGTTTGASLNVTIADSEASNPGSTGVVAISSSGHPATVVMLRNFVASNNSVGVQAFTNAFFLVAHSVVTGNGTGVDTSGGGTICSYGDNDINGNTTDIMGALSPCIMR
jgi:hypothetical protein